MGIFRKSLDYIIDHKKEIGVVIFSGVVIAAAAVIKKKNKSKFSLRPYGINKSR